jgi:hypothetical protein
MSNIDSNAVGEMYAQLGQDFFVLEQLNFKKQGFYVDIGCERPKTISNTYALELHYDWSGVAIDLVDHLDTNKESWKNLRPNSKHILGDALEIDYTAVFKNNNLPEIIDYLSLDLEPPQVTLQCLYKIPFETYKFRVITFETDEYREGGDMRKEASRAFLKEKGYFLVKNVNRQDDFYILNPSA